MSDPRELPLQTKDAALTPTTDTKPVEVEVKCPTVDEVKISYGANANQTAMTATGLKVLREICSKACIASVEITSTARDVKDQARIMYDMIKSKGVSYVNGLYGAGGKTIVSVYEESVKNKLSEGDTKKAMADKMDEIGPSTVSHHIVSANGKLCVFDVAPSSVGDDTAKKRFVIEAKAHASVPTFFEPPKDPAYHLEVTN
jgi:DNA-binding NarL/FixJ family response regulator